MPLSKNEEETHKLGEKIADKIINGGVVCLFGDLGSGKTTFTKGIADKLGIDKFSIKSPTYTYIRYHKSKGSPSLYHIDLYRLDIIDNLLLEEINELIEDKKNIIVIEWADRMGENLPKNRINVYFQYLDENNRDIRFS